MNRHHIILFILLFTSFLLYLPAAEYGMVTDFLSWMQKYEHGSWIDILHCFSYPGLHQFFHLVNFIVFLLFDNSPYAWQFLFSLMHGLNAFLVFQLIHQWHGSRYIAGLTAFGFLIFPFNTEPVLWKACLHYLIVTAFLLVILIYTLKIIKTANQKQIWSIHIIYILALFTLELAFVMPLLSGILIMSTTRTGEKIRPAFLYIVIPQLILLGLYLLLNRLLLGTVVGHYGTATHLAFSLPEVTGTAISYFVKNLIMVHFWPHDLKNTLYALCHHPGIIGFALVSLAALVLYWSRHLTFRPAAFLLCFLVSLLPVLNLYFNHVLLFENDRYGYLASVFFLAFFFSAAQKLPSPLGSVISFLYVIMCLSLFSMMINNGRTAGKIYHSLIEKFPRVTGNDTIVILGIPDNYRGFYLFRDYGDHARFFRQAHSFIKKEDVRPVLINPAQYNAMNGDDCLAAVSETDSRIKIHFTQDGNWFYKNGIGLSDYTREFFRVQRNPWSYTFHGFFPNNPTYLYSCGGEWKFLLPDIEN